ncbi:efflux RND transporter periplasmic adaptor subunit [Persicobacter diffluens]
MRLYWWPVLLLMAACSSKENETQNQKAALVKAIKVQSVQEGSKHIYTGISAPNKEVALSFRVSGPLSAFNLEEGQYLKKGAFMGQIDPRDFKINLNKAEASFEQRKADRDRAERLHGKNNISQQQYDLAIAQFQNAEAELNNAKNALRDTRISAPFSGFVKTVDVEKGEHVAASQQVVTFLDFSKLKVRCSIPEALALNQDQIEKVTVSFEGLPEKAFDARIKEIGRDPDHIRFAYPMILEIDQPEKGLIGGMPAEVSVYLKEGDANGIMLPSTALMGRPNGEIYVWGVKNGHLEKVQVEVKNLANNDWVNVLPASQDSEWIVSAGGTYLHEGQEVRVKEEVRNVSMR